MARQNRTQRRDSSADGEEYVLLMSPIPRAAKWQEVKDITNMYSGDHVRIADIVEADPNAPDHRIGYAFIVGYAHADKGFNHFSKYGWHGRSIRVSLNGPVDRSKSASGDFMRDLQNNRIKSGSFTSTSPHPSPPLPPPQILAAQRHYQPQMVYVAASSYPQPYLQHMQPSIPVLPRYPPHAPTFSYSQAGSGSSRHSRSGQTVPFKSRTSQQPRSSRHAVGPQRQEARHPVPDRHSSNVADHRFRVGASDPQRWDSRGTSSKQSESDRPAAASRRSTSRRDASHRHSKSLATEEPLVVNGARGRRHRCRDSSDEESEGSDRDCEASKSTSENEPNVRGLTRRMRNL